MIWLPAAVAFLVGGSVLPKAIPSAAASKFASSSVARIDTTFFVHSFATPWQPARVRRSGGTGFLLPGGRLLTNAHVVSRANTIRVQRPDQRTDYEARVLHVAHDCDLALLEVKDRAFFEDSAPLELGSVPELNTPVMVMGFPIGGNRVSITRGVVSRIGMDRYSHTLVDWHQVIQVDAAINPGNSGGPAIQDGRVIGVAFQVYRRGQNLGYLIPPTVVRRFLADVEDGRYDGYTDLGIIDHETTNPVLRGALGFKKAGVNMPDTGVLVYGVMPGSSADGNLQVGDVLLALNGKSISHRGDVLVGGHPQAYSEYVDNLIQGDKIEALILRDGKKQTLRFAARRSSILDYQRPDYNRAPRYHVSAGLVFQPLTADLRGAYQRRWTELRRTELSYRYDFFMQRGLHRKVRGDVVLTRLLADPINRHADAFQHRIIKSVNGQAVLDFDDFVEKMNRARAASEPIVLVFRQELRPLVLRPADVRAADERIPKRYRIARSTVQ